ncbi:MAG: hypothetical protein ACI841_001015 [Planctomycetota bacterium]|jgi:hypothetical protein
MIHLQSDVVESPISLGLNPPRLLGRGILLPRTCWLRHHKDAKEEFE